jgi:hypothetical protein
VTERTVRGISDSVEHQVQLHDEGNYLARDHFRWSVNRLVCGIRPAAEAIVRRVVNERGQLESPTVDELDLSLQVMLSLCHYEPQRVWGDGDGVACEIGALVVGGFPEAANQAFADAIGDGRLALDAELTEDVAHREVSRLRKLYSARHLGNVALPDLSSSADPFGVQGAAISSAGREHRTNKDGMREVVVHERMTGQPIVLRQVEPMVSAAYAAGFHYLHEPRGDELQSFGAFTENAEYPFAWVTYSPIATAYEQDIVRKTGVAPERVVEMTRAWNTSWSPKNMMSTLFSYAHRELQHSWLERGWGDKPLNGVLTSINPNLGFRANAFSGVDFGVVGLKPSSYKYLLDEQGHPTYMLRRAIARELGVSVAGLDGHPRYGRNAMPLLPGYVMMVLFDRKCRIKPSGPIYVVGRQSYQQEQQRRAEGLVCNQEQIDPTAT